MKLKQIIVELITQQEQHIKQLRIEKYAYSPTQYNHEFKTVGLCTARQTGKSTMIREMYRPGDLIIVHNEVAKQAYPHGWNVKSIRQYDERWRAMPIEEYGYVFFDEFSFMNNELIRNVYEYTNADWYIKLST